MSLPVFAWQKAVKEHAGQSYVLAFCMAMQSRQQQQDQKGHKKRLITHKMEHGAPAKFTRWRSLCLLGCSLMFVCCTGGAVKGSRTTRYRLLTTCLGAASNPVQRREVYSSAFLLTGNKDQAKVLS